MARSKRYKKALESIDRSKLYALEEAIGIIKDMPDSKFDESVDIAISLGVDPKHADQMVRGAVVLPNGVGKSVRVLVFDDDFEEWVEPGDFGDVPAKAKVRIVRK